MTELAKFWADDPKTWWFWRDWYEGMLAGTPMDWALQEAVALISNDVWDAGPEAVAAEIERIRASTRFVGQIEEAIPADQLSDAEGSVRELDDTALVRVRDQVSTILALGPQAMFSAEFSAAQIDLAIEAYREDTGYPNALPPELETLLALGASFRRIGELSLEINALGTGTSAKDAKIAELERHVALLERQVRALEAALANTKERAGRQVAVGVLEGAGSAILSHAVLMGGPPAAEAVGSLWNLLFPRGVPPTAPMLPPSVTI